MRKEMMNSSVVILLICGIVTVVVGLPLLLCRMFLLRKARSEFDNFCKDAEETVWIEENNPLYVGPVSRFQNPTYCEQAMQKSLVEIR